jgi:hypothetical protein
MPEANRCGRRAPGCRAGWRRGAAAGRRRGPLGRGAAGRGRPDGARCWPARCCPAWWMRTATPSSAPSPAWPSAATAARRLLVLARPHVPRGAAHHAAQLRAIAAQLYGELLPAATPRSASSTTCSTARTAAPYADPAGDGLGAGRRGGSDAGIGLTLLPVLYERAGFAQPALREDQRRFATDADWRAGRCRAFAAGRAPDCRRGHPLAARRGAGVRSHLLAQWPRADGRSTSTWPSRPPRWTTAWRHRPRPIEWLAPGRSMRAGSWCMPPTPRRGRDRRRGARGAGVVLCPGTEANLGDGLPTCPAG